MSAIIVKVGLLGAISGRVKHTTKQKHTVKVDDNEYVSKIILYTDRLESICTRSFKVSDEVVKSWIYGESPLWEDSRDWKRFSIHQKLLSYIKGFDEGYGVSYEYLS